MSRTARRNRFLVGIALIALAASVLATVWLLGFNGVQQLKAAIATLNLLEQTPVRDPIWIISYAVICIVSQCLIVPSGSLILIAAGFIFGPIVATVIYSVAQVLTTWPVVSFSRWLLDNYQPRILDRLLSLSAVSRVIDAVGQEDFMAGVVVRLTPVIPSAAACLLAVSVNLRFISFMLATVCVCWVRPLFFASVGGAVRQLSSLEVALQQTESIDPTPILLVFVSSVLLLLVRLWLRRKAHR